MGGARPAGCAAGLPFFLHTCGCAAGLPFFFTLPRYSAHDVLSVAVSFDELKLASDRDALVGERQETLLRYVLYCI